MTLGTRSESEVVLTSFAHRHRGANHVKPSSLTRRVPSQEIETARLASRRFHQSLPAWE